MLTALPRLRYFWHHVHAINNEPALAEALPPFVFIVEHLAHPPGGLRYRLDRIGKLPQPTDPWSPIARSTLPNGRAELLLYQLGEDEGAAGGLIQHQMTSTLPFHAVLVIRTNYTLEPSQSGSSEDCVKLGQDLRQRLVPTTPRMPKPQPPPPPFLLLDTTDPTLPLARIVVLCQPSFTISKPNASPALRIVVVPKTESPAGVRATAFSDGSLAITRGPALAILDRDGVQRGRLETPDGEAFVTPPAPASDGSIWVATATKLYVAR